MQKSLYSLFSYKELKTVLTELFHILLRKYDIKIFVTLRIGEQMIKTPNNNITSEHPILFLKSLFFITPLLLLL